MWNIVDQVKHVQESVIRAAQRCGRNPSDICVVAVSKTHPPEAIRDGYAAGLRIFGENRVQEAEEKIRSLADLGAEWHLVGHLQTNKVKKVLPLFRLIHSVDSPRLIEALESEAEYRNQRVSILLQVNLSGETTKFGAACEDLESLLVALRNAPHLQCRGLMTLPPFVEDPEEVRPFFRRLRQLGERYRVDLVGSGSQVELSMGMTHDFPIAIEEGATIVRIGTAIFGSRNS